MARGLPNAILSDQLPMTIILKGGRKWRFLKNSTTNSDIEDKKGLNGKSTSHIGDHNYTTMYENTSELAKSVKNDHENAIKNHFRLQKSTYSLPTRNKKPLKTPLS